MYVAGPEGWSHGILYVCARGANAESSTANRKSSIWGVSRGLRYTCASQ